MEMMCAHYTPSAVHKDASQNRGRWGPLWMPTHIHRISPGNLPLVLHLLMEATSCTKHGKLVYT